MELPALLLPSLKTLQYVLMPVGACAGMLTGIYFTRLPITKKYGFLLFWGTLVCGILVVKLASMIGGDAWARISFAYSMGYLAFSMKMLR